ncbi:hypothetical protein [Azospirillum sp. ST 5-10]|uniref:hypothetical protein n=1 Tax=unclassified Azospirillum TaxID=2630922 RepID=UPI003F4A6385
MTPKTPTDLSETVHPADAPQPLSDEALESVTGGASFSVPGTTEPPTFTPLGNVAVN